MSETGLNGVRVLVVEDDYYLATDAKAALMSAGADVLGPCGDEESGLRMVAETGIGCAVLDLNLGPGPSFELARALRSRGVPFLFVTGYDQEAIPAEFSDVRRIEKPYRDRDLLGAVAALV